MTEFVIIGGGAYGCAVAYHLARNGADVVVLEAGKIADGASGGAGKRGVRGNRRDLREIPLMREAYDMWPSLGQELQAEIGYERTGGMYLIEEETVGSSGGLVAAQAHAEFQRRLGIPTEVMGREQLDDIYPDVSDRVRAGLFAPLDGMAPQVDVTVAYAAAARRAGAEIREGTAAELVETDAHGRAIAVRAVSGERLAARRGVLVANNAGAQDLVQRSCGLSLPLWNIYPQALFLQAENTVAIPLLTGHDSRTLSVKVLADDVIMLSGGWRGRRDPVTGQGKLVPEHLEGNIAQLRAVFPGLGRLEVLEADASRPEAVAADQIPFVGPLSENLFLAAGWSGHGWALVPSASQHIAQMLFTGEQHSSLVPLSPARINLRRS